MSNRRELKQAEDVSQETHRYARSIIDTVREPFVVLDRDLKVLSANRSFYSTFEVTPHETVGNLIYDIGNRQWDIPSLRTLLKEIIPEKTQFNNYEVTHKFQIIGQKIMLLNARQIYQKVIGTPMILLAIEDITEKRRMEDELRKYRENLELQVEERTAELKMSNEHLLQDITERKKAEEALKESEEMYRTLIEFSNDMIWAADLDGRFRFCNKHAEEISGYQLEEWRNKMYSPLIMKEELPNLMEIFSKILQGQPQQYDATVKKRDGGALILSINSAPIYSKGAMIGTVSFGRDITQHKKAEEALKESEEGYRRIVEYSPFGIAIHSEGKLVYMNLAGAKILGTENPGEIVGKMLIQIVHPDYHEIAKNRARMQEEGKIAPPLEEKFLKLDGTSVDVEVTSIPLIYMGKPAMYGVFRDITERKQAEEIQRKLSKAVEHTADIVVIAGKDGTIEYVNPAFEKITGYTMEEAVGKTPRILKSGKQDEKFYKHLWGKILSGEVFYGVLINKKNNGELYYTEKTITPVKDEHGTITHFVSTDKDITENKKAEAIHLENLRLEAADKAKSEFLANMSHELRTPLNSIIGFSDLMKQGLAGKLDKKQEHFIDNISTSGLFLLSLINDILDLSKIEAGKIELVPDKMSVPETIKETLSLIKEKAMKHKVLLKTEFDPELEFIVADKQRFKQVIFNLLSNAVKFSKEEGGTVTIATKKEGDMAQISVSDTGIGIKEENLGKLFNKFEQLEKGISNKYGGTGLGLAITKQLVELHGGRIWAQSRYGDGSMFIFTLPLKVKKGGNGG